MSDVAFVALTIAVFAVMALVVRGVEHMVEPLERREPADSLGSEQHTAHTSAGHTSARGSEGSGGGVAGAGVVGVATPADGQVVR